MILQKRKWNFSSLELNLLIDFDGNLTKLKTEVKKIERELKRKNLRRFYWMIINLKYNL